MEPVIVSTKYFGELDLSDLLIFEDKVYSLPLDGRQTDVTVNFCIISTDAFSEGDWHDFLDSMDAIPEIYRLARRLIRSEFDRRTLFTRRIKNHALREFITAQEATTPNLHADALMDGLKLHAIVFGQGYFGDFCCELYFRFGTECDALLCAEFHSPDHFGAFYFHDK